MLALAGRWAPLKKWDALGVDNTLKEMEAAGNKPAQWVYDMLSSGVKKLL